MNNSEDIKALLQAEHFRPFSVTLKTGKIFYVRGRDYAWVRPLSGTIHLVDNLDKLYIFSPREVDYVETDEKAVESE